MHDTHLDILVNKARERLTWPGAPVDATSLRVWQPGDLDRLDSFTAKADQLVADAYRDLRTLAADPDTSDRFKAKRRPEVIARVRDQLARLEADADAIGREVEALTERAPRLTVDAQGRYIERPTPAPDPVRELKARETRDLLRQMDESQREQLVLGAVRDGDDATLDAVLAAPSAFKVLGPDARQRIEQASVERSPAYPALLSLRQLQSFSGMVLGHVRQRVADLDAYGPRVTPAPSEDPRQPSMGGPTAA